MSAVMNSIDTHTAACNLRKLLQGIVTAQELDAISADIYVSDITLDSRDVQPGGVFVALSGSRTHGLEFAQQAITKGARAVLWEVCSTVDEQSVPKSSAAILVLAIQNLRSLLGAIANRFFAEPSSHLQIAGVTGTNGKTTSAYLIAAALSVLNRKAAYSGTLGYGAIDALQYSGHTTPDCISVHRQLASMHAAQQTQIGMEVSSHALDQGRIDGVLVHTALFTNLTRDHLDYHGTLEAYGTAKAKLFERNELQRAVINVGDEFGANLARGLIANQNSTCSVTVYSRDPAALLSFKGQDATLVASKIKPTAHGLLIDIDGSYGCAQLQSRMIGAFNVENLLGVLGVLLGWNISLPQAVYALQQCKAPPGRMENVSSSDQPTVVVDYAHTPDALEKALQTAREHCLGKLICVFGCGGERDVGKRPQMGAIASRLADTVIVTDDNPRMEEGQKIIDDILRGSSSTTLTIRDREHAIAKAISLADIDDCVLIAGKGHEDYQIVGRNTLHFSDVEVARRYLNNNQSERRS
jgi:UDP-N-acetylmuramoyl-L-alanyl-D-glutamate--2,6-diaminopimelate ligase